MEKKERTIKAEQGEYQEDQVVEFKDGLARIKWELLFFLVNLAAVGIFPAFHLVMFSKAAEDLVFKALLVNAGALHAHVMRKALFPYIDFANEPDRTNKLLVIALYVVVIFSYARGG